MSDPFEVPNPIICSPYDEPLKHWHIVEGEPLEERQERRSAQYFYRPPGSGTGAMQTGDAGTPIPLELFHPMFGRNTMTRLGRR